MTDAPSLPRTFALHVLAGTLAGGGLLWGVLLLFSFGPVALVAPPYCFGYLVTAGYILRTVSIPAFGVRVAVWVVSLAVQGGWLVVAGIPSGLNVATAWWLFATLASVFGLGVEVWVNRVRELARPSR